MPGGGFNPPQRRRRGSDNPADVPFFQVHDYNCYVTTLRLPQDTDMNDWGFNSVFDTMLYGDLYYRMMGLRKADRSLRLVRGNRVEETEISPATAERDNARLPRFDNSMAILSYLPGGFGELGDQSAQVPAISESDWTGPNPPCLPVDTSPASK